MNMLAELNVWPKWNTDWIFKCATNDKACLDNTCKQNEERGREPPQKTLIACIFKAVNGDFFFDIWLFLPKCLKTAVEKKNCLSPLIFFSLLVKCERFSCRIRVGMSKWGRKQLRPPFSGAVEAQCSGQGLGAPARVGRGTSPASSVALTWVLGWSGAAPSAAGLACPQTCLQTLASPFGP